MYAGIPLLLLLWCKLALVYVTLWFASVFNLTDTHIMSIQCRALHSTKSTSVTRGYFCHDWEVSSFTMSRSKQDWLSSWHTERTTSSSWKFVEILACVGMAGPPNISNPIKAIAQSIAARCNIRYRNQGGPWQRCSWKNSRICTCSTFIRIRFQATSTLVRSCSSAAFNSRMAMRAPLIGLKGALWREGVPDAAQQRLA